MLVIFKSEEMSFMDCGPSFEFSLINRSLHSTITLNIKFLYTLKLCQILFAFYLASRNYVTVILNC